MRIGELAGQLGLNPRTIRYYESVGLLPDPERTGGNYRDYGTGDLERLRFIRAAQQFGLRLDEIREVLAFAERGEPPCGYVRDTLRRQVAAIDTRIAELQELRGELAGLESRAAELPPPPPGGCCPLVHAGQDRHRARSSPLPARGQGNRARDARPRLARHSTWAEGAS